MTGLTDREAGEIIAVLKNLQETTDRIERKVGSLDQKVAQLEKDHQNLISRGKGFLIGLMLIMGGTGTFVLNLFGS